MWPVVELADEGARVASAETHVSVVLFVGARAYKLAKPVAIDVLDLSDTSLRTRALREELAQNRRFSPDVYLGLATLGPEAGSADADELGAAEPVLVMRRMPEDRRLSALLRTEGADDALRQVARRVAAIHAEAPRTPVADEMAGPDRVADLWDESLDTMEATGNGTFDHDTLAEVRRRAHRYVDGRGDLFERRIADGHARDGHGDLLADDIFLLDDGPRILDCLAFDERLRSGDVLADVAFLVMDTERIAGETSAARLMGLYGEYSGEHHPGTLAHFYVAYRALVRAKVAGVRAGQGDGDAAGLARDHLDQCLSHLRRAEVRAVLVGGAPATGKSTIGEVLSSVTGWSLLGSDEIRKDLAGVGHEDHPDHDIDGGLYDPGVSDRTYDELVRRARRLVALGEPVVLDASWQDASRRKAARVALVEAGASTTEVRCDLDPSLADERLEARRRGGRDASDATVEVARRVRDRFEPWPEAIVVDTSADVESCIDGLLARLVGRPWAEG
ncbi:MAG: AAA family ATPase [Actinomycetota bacterium]|nr:AAA family ATPase [Actinomycetota bacterium]